MSKVNILCNTQTKKKRSALENISNATGFSNNNCVGLNGKEVIKKSRYGSGQVLPAFSSTTSNNAAPTLRKSDSLFVSKKTLSTNISSTKDSTLTRNQSGKIQSSKSATKNAETANLPKSFSASTTSYKKIEQNDFQNFKIDPKMKIQNLEPSLVEMNIERQLATTCISTDNLTVNFDTEKSNSSIRIELNKQGSLKSQLIEEPIEDWDNIDENDNDEFNVADYVTYIFKHYREREEKFIVKDYIKNQPLINKQMRHLLVDWMVEVQQQLEFNHEVLYLSVKLLDLYLNRSLIKKEKLQLLGGAAMFIACKFEERMPPIIDDFIYVSDNAYDRAELIEMEIDILKTVCFDIGAPLSYTFLRRYSKCIKADMRFLTLARYILELSLQDYHFAYVKDSLKACAALYLALKMTVGFEDLVKSGAVSTDSQTQYVTTANLSSTEWNKTLVHYTECKLEDFIDLLPSMNNLVISAPSSKYKTIFKKYSHQVFYEVAKIPSLSSREVEQMIQNCYSEQNQS